MKTKLILIWLLTGWMVANATDPLERTARPWPLFLNASADPSTGMSLAWQTDLKTQKTVVEWVCSDDPSGFRSKQVGIARGTVQSFSHITETGEKGRKYQANTHRVRITGLQPDTRYNYRAGDGKTWAEGTFRTAPARTTEDTIKFLFLADSQSSSREAYQSIFKRVLDKAVELNPDARFMIHAGDMTNRGCNAQEWSWFFEAGESTFRQLLFAPNVGNHEANGVPEGEIQKENQFYLPYFNNPANGLFADGSSYSFDYGYLHVVCVDNQCLDNALELQKATGNSQYVEAARQWLDHDLSQSKAEWKIVTMHQPIFGANRDEKELRAVLAPLFDKHNVDLVLSGHDHYYFRSFPLRYNAQTNDGEAVTVDQKAPTYIIGGSTCGKMYVTKYARLYQAVTLAANVFPAHYPWLRGDVLPLQNFSSVTATRNTLHFRFFDLNGVQHDEVTITKK